jgi:hypothetical protein
MPPLIERVQGETKAGERQSRSQDLTMTVSGGAWVTTPRRD